MGLVWIDFLPSGEVAHSLWWIGRKGFYVLVPENRRVKIPSKYRAQKYSLYRYWLKREIARITLSALKGKKQQKKKTEETKK